MRDGTHFQQRLGLITTTFRDVSKIVVLLTVSKAMVLCDTTAAVGNEQPANSDTEQAREAEYAARISMLTTQIDNNPTDLNLYSRRGDARFFAGQFAEAVADYSKMVELDPKTDASHWRRGIAYFYAGEYDKAAAQFDRYHSFDDVDRENGIWRYLSHYQSKGAMAARQELLKYEKDDREPFGDVYQLFAGTITGDEILSKIQAAELSAAEREKRIFYASLYVGLNNAVEGRTDSAKKHLELAARNNWAPRAGYGPHYMWQVARLHAQHLTAKSTD